MHWLIKARPSIPVVHLTHFQGGWHPKPWIFFMHRVLYSNCLAEFHNICQVDWQQPGGNTPLFKGCWCWDMPFLEGLSSYYCHYYFTNLFSAVLLISLCWEFLQDDWARTTSVLIWLLCYMTWNLVCCWVTWCTLVITAVLTFLILTCLKRVVTWDWFMLSVGEQSYWNILDVFVWDLDRSQPLLIQNTVRFWNLIYDANVVQCQRAPMWTWYFNRHLLNVAVYGSLTVFWTWEFIQTVVFNHHLWFWAFFK